MARRESNLSAEALQSGGFSFAEVVNAHWSAVYRLLYRLTGDTHDTEDLTQETFMRALNRLDTFAPDTRMRSWLMRIATNAFFDVERKKHRAGVTSLEFEPAAAGKLPEEVLEIAEESELVRVAMRELPAKTRLVFHLRVQEDLSFREIAELADTTEQAARWHMHQARSILLQRLDGKL